MGQEFSTTKGGIRPSELGDAFLDAPLNFLKRHPDALLVHRSRDQRLPRDKLRDMQEHAVATAHFSRRKRFALKLETTTYGPLCVKFRSLSWPESWMGPLHAKAEYQRHTEVQRRGFAATEPLGIGSWRDKSGKRWQYFAQRGSTHLSSGESLLKEGLSAPKLAYELATLHNADIFTAI